MKRLASSFLCVFALTVSAQTILEAPGLAAFSSTAVAGGGGGACDTITSASFYGRLDEASGTRADTSGNGNDLTVGGSPGSAAAVIGNGSTFTGPAIISHVSNSSLQCGAQDFSLTVWAKFTSTSGNQVIAAKGSEFILWLTGGVIVFNSNGGSGGSGANLTSSATISSGTQYHILIVMKNTGVVKQIFVQSSGSYTSNGIANAGGSFTSTSDDFTVGNYPGGSFPALGTIDEVGLFKALLTNVDATNLYNGGSGCRPSSF